MNPIKTVSRQEWLTSRLELLKEEKEFDRKRDQLSRKKRNLPWVRVEKEYTFETTSGMAKLSDLFGECSQLIIYHFMYGPDWNDGCTNCSFWADNFNGINIHLNHRDINLVVVSRAPLHILQAYKNRMDWDFNWVSSFNSDFNFDYQVSFTPEEMEKGEMFHNFHMEKFSMEEAPGISVFYKNDQGEVFHTYSTYRRGLDMFNGAYHYMDITPKGRDEDDLSYTMAWLRRHDQYDD